VEIVIREPLAKYIIAKAEEEGVQVEELLARMVVNELSDEEKIELYVELHEKYLSEAKALEDKGDIAQAGEKLWGAVCALLSALGELRGWRHHSHRDYCDIIERLVAEFDDPELSRLFASAERLHANYYHAFLHPESFKAHRDAVLELIRRLREVLGYLSKQSKNGKAQKEGLSSGALTDKV